MNKKFYFFSFQDIVYKAFSTSEDTPLKSIFISVSGNPISKSLNAGHGTSLAFIDDNNYIASQRHSSVIVFEEGKEAFKTEYKSKIFS